MTATTAMADIVARMVARRIARAADDFRNSRTTLAAVLAGESTITTLNLAPLLRAQARHEIWQFVAQATEATGGDLQAALAEGRRHFLQQLLTGRGRSTSGLDNEMEWVRNEEIRSFLSSTD
ncbi:hypothetical protein [Planomonospora sp. ID82291]|uniref:hypothetical protein n=1 Tax=Planomonospora sp. ID82291 TaxID=2738136 RepID=UPI0018C3D4F2|nr:hypothetical protein [Planomonospora sp. ID82291]MBG0818291.1 hypothetical protein [Planomonospora sp. ID82291]